MRNTSFFLVISYFWFIFAAYKINAEAMKSTQEYVSMLKQHASELREQFGIKAMRLFGSVAMGEQKEGSDIDLFVEMAPDMYNIVAAHQYLEDLLGCDVDLIRNHRNIRPFFLEQINKYGITIFSAA